MATTQHVLSSVTIERPADELYAFWRRLDNMPKFMFHLRSVHETDVTHSHWVADGPGGTRIEWDGEITDDVRGEQIAWRTLPGSPVMHHGIVRFVPAPGDRGTEVHLEMWYEQPFGRLGQLVAKIAGENPKDLDRESLRNFKRLMETGVIPTVAGQSHGSQSVAKVA